MVPFPIDAHRMGNQCKEKVLVFHAAEKFDPNAMQSARPLALRYCQKDLR
jgi:hypothetical protein